MFMRREIVDYSLYQMLFWWGVILWQVCSLLFKPIKYFFWECRRGFRRRRMEREYRTHIKQVMEAAVEKFPGLSMDDLLSEVSEIHDAELKFLYLKEIERRMKEGSDGR